MGFVDRGGGREAKGASLRRSKKNPGAGAARNKSANKNYITPTTRATPTPPAACAPIVKALAEAFGAAESTDAAALTATEAPVVEMVCAQAQQQSASPLHIDTAVALLSRKLEDDQEGIFRRAVEEGKLAGALCWCNEVEKQAALLDTCVQRNKLYRAAAAAPPSSAPAAADGVRHVHFHDDVLAASPVAVTGGAAHASASLGVSLYAIIGVHVNSIDRVNMRLHDQWIKELEENVKHGDVIGVLSGLNLSRDHGTHYAQERLLHECWRVAGTARLPLVLHLYAADSGALTETVNRAAELVTELLNAAASDAEGAAATPSAVVLYNGLAALQASSAMQQLVRTHRPSAVSTGATSGTAFYVLVSAEGLVERPSGKEDGADGAVVAAASVESLAALLPSRSGNAKTEASPSVVHLTQLLIGTGAPWGTPQNLPDPYTRTLPNEPGNYPYVVDTVFQAMPSAPHPMPSPQVLAAHVFVNQLRLFFRECVEDAMTEAAEAAAEDADAAQQRKWAESQQPATPTAVAGLADADAKRDLEALLAAAAAERARVEAEREKEEAARAQARSDELLEKRSKREKKKHVKANNRSNFSHFRNKDFAPRQTKQERQEHQRSLEGHVPGETDSEGDEEEENNYHGDGATAHTAGAGAATVGTEASHKPQQHRPSPSSDEDSEEDEEGDGNGAGGSLAAEVEMLLREAEREGQRGKGDGGKAKGGKKGSKGGQQPSGTTANALPAAAAGKSKAAKKNAKKGGKHADPESAEAGEERAAGGGTDESSENADGGAATMQGQQSRRQRKRQQKRQQHQSRGDDSDDD